MTDHPDFDLSRRKMFQAMAAGAAASTAMVSPVFAQAPPATSVISSADYVRDPNRWGTAEVAAFFPGFQHVEMKTSGAIIRLRHGGSGPPLLLIHGNPLSHFSLFKNAARLLPDYYLVLPHFRGFCDRSLPRPGANHNKYT